MKMATTKKKSEIKRDMRMVETERKRDLLKTVDMRHGHFSTVFYHSFFAAFFFSSSSFSRFEFKVQNKQTKIRIVNFHILL